MKKIASLLNNQTWNELYGHRNQWLTKMSKDVGKFSLFSPKNSKVKNIMLH